MKTLNVVTAVFVITLPAACAAKQLDTSCQPAQRHLGIVPIGGVPKDMKAFASSDCESTSTQFADCSAIDFEGRRYAFFAGALARVSARVTNTKNLCLPAGVRFGETIDVAARIVSEALGVKLVRGVSPRGEVVYSSGFVVRSSTGVHYSVELEADKAFELVEFVERTDF